MIAVQNKVGEGFSPEQLRSKTNTIDRDSGELKNVKSAVESGSAIDFNTILEKSQDQTGVSLTQGEKQLKGGKPNVGSKSQSVVVEEQLAGVNSESAKNDKDESIYNLSQLAAQSVVPVKSPYIQSNKILSSEGEYKGNKDVVQKFGPFQGNVENTSPQGTLNNSDAFLNQVGRGQSVGINEHKMSQLDGTSKYQLPISQGAFDSSSMENYLQQGRPMRVDQVALTKSDTVAILNPLDSGMRYSSDHGNMGHISRSIDPLSIDRMGSLNPDQQYLQQDSRLHPSLGGSGAVPIHAASLSHDPRAMYALENRMPLSEDFVGARSMVRQPLAEQSNQVGHSLNSEKRFLHTGPDQVGQLDSSVNKHVLQGLPYAVPAIAMRPEGVQISNEINQEAVAHALAQEKALTAISKQKIDIVNSRALANQIAHIASVGGGEVRVKVSPESLGDLTISVNKVGKQIDVKIDTSTENARDLISKNISDLKHVLNQNHYNVARIEVQHQNAVSERAMMSYQDGGNLNNSYGRSDQQSDSHGSAWNRYYGQDWAEQFSGDNYNRNSNGRRYSGYRQYQDVG